MYSDVIVSTFGCLDESGSSFRVSCHEPDNGDDPFVVLRAGGLLALHFGDPAVLARYAATVVDAQQRLHAALQRQGQSPLPVDTDAGTDIDSQAALSSDQAVA